jgi:hypothetical protein
MAEAEVPSLREWRQGSILPQAAARDLNLIPAENSDSYLVVVVSHDCDIVNFRHESDVEVIVARIASSANGNLTGGKNSRILHLDWNSRNGVKNIELRAVEKRRLSKYSLAGVLPDASYELDEKNLATFRFWLGARYDRAAFPDEFNNRLSKTKIAEDIIKILKPLGSLVTGVYIRISTHDELPSHDPTRHYRVHLFIAYESGDEPLENAERADAAANAIDDAFKNRCFDTSTEQWSWLELKDCVPVSEDELTVGQAKRLQQLPLEYLSLRTTPQGATPLGVTRA